VFCSGRRTVTFRASYKCTAFSNRTVYLCVQPNKRLAKKLPKHCEVANILVGQVRNVLCVIFVLVVVV